MSNKNAKTGVCKILSKLPAESVLALAATVTQGMLKDKVKSKKDAIQAIIRYSPNMLSILKRQKVTREVLLEYMHDCQIPIKLPATKPELVERIRLNWCGHKRKVGVTKNASTDNDSSVNVLAVKFSEWFYSMMNTSEAIGTEHFFPDSKLNMNLINEQEVITEKIENSPNSIVQKLYSTKHNHSLFFNPNLTKEGIKGCIDKHGLVVVVVSGTLHCRDICVGVFEQMFSLARDPSSENNWKIKSTDLSLRKKDNVMKLPTLTDGNITKDLLCLFNK